jgi:hypothetical protein
VEYFNAPDRSSRQLFNVLSLSLAGTPMEQQVCAVLVGGRTRSAREARVVQLGLP